MGWYSILPEHLSDLETWIARTFLLLGLVTMGPWALLLIYDILYYTWRTATYHIPVVGGKAQGKRRPRAPSLTERPSGDKREFGMHMPGSASGFESHESDGSNLRRDDARAAAVQGG